VEAEETLGHYADWAEIPTWRVRRANGFRYGRPIRFGQKVRVPISASKVVDFNLKRLQYHQALEEDLFANYSVEGTDTYKVRRGDTLEEITKRFEVPFWLLKRYQEDQTGSRLHVGQKLTIPRLVATSGAIPPTETDDEDNEALN